MKDLELSTLTLQHFPLMRYAFGLQFGYFAVHKIFMKFAPKRYLAKKLPNKKVVFREIKNSIRSLAILSVFPVFLMISKANGYTMIYSDVRT